MYRNDRVYYKNTRKKGQVMLEILFSKKEEEKIALVENGNLIEYYEDDGKVERKEGNIYIGCIKDIMKGMQAAFVDIGTEKNAFIHVKDLLPKVDETKKQTQKNIKISDVVKPNQKVLVQIKKDSNEQKGARVSTHISLPSKYIVLMPNTDIITISQKIEKEEERKRLYQLAKENLQKGNGAIIRTSSEGKEAEVIEDIKQTEKIWDSITKKYNDATRSKDFKVGILYKAESVLNKMLIDLSNEKIERVIMDNEQEVKNVEQFLKENPELKNIKIEKSNEHDLFSKYDIEKQVEKIQKRKVWLKCGGFITIDKTEALTAIDVNTGKYTGTKDLEQTIFTVNKEATLEIAKQLRLRDIGGIIIIDYIDMKNQEYKNKIQELLIQKLKEDRSKTQVEGFTKLDLMEMTRKHICSHK